MYIADQSISNVCAAARRSWLPHAPRQPCAGVDINKAGERLHRCRRLFLAEWAVFFRVSYTDIWTKCP